MRPSRERLAEIRKFSEKTVQTWSAMECPKENMIYDLLAEIDALQTENDKLRFENSGYGLQCLISERDELKTRVAKLREALEKSNQVTCLRDSALWGPAECLHCEEIKLALTADDELEKQQI